MLRHRLVALACGALVLLSVNNGCVSKPTATTLQTTIIIDEPLGTLWLPTITPTAPTATTTATEPSRAYLGTFKVTAYCPCRKCCGKGRTDPLYGITATGDNAIEGICIGVDPNIIPYGTLVYIENVGTRIAQDCGNYHGNRIDLFFAHHQDALNFGVKTLNVWVILD